jgi:hypothetical protein
MSNQFPPVAILNCAIVTSNGIYECYDCTLEEAREIIRDSKGFISAVGHEATARILTELLGVEVPMNRIQFEQEHNQTALVFKLNGRVPEGKILNREEIESIGYSFKTLYKAPSSYQVSHI